MEVFIVSQGVNYDGSHRVGVFSDLSKAKKIVNEMVESHNAQQQYKNLMYVAKTELYWSVGDMYIEIEKENVN